MKINLNLNFDLVDNQYFDWSNTIDKQDMSALCTPLSYRNYDFDESYKKIIQEQNDEEYPVTDVIAALNTDSWFIIDHFEWRDRFFQIDALTLNAFQSDNILNFFNTERLSNYVEKNILELFRSSNDTFGIRDHYQSPLNQVRFLLESEWNFEKIDIWDSQEWDYCLIKEHEIKSNKLNRIDDRIIFSLFNFIFNKIRPFKIINEFSLGVHGGNTHRKHDYGDIHRPETYSSFFSDYLNIFNALYQIKYIRNKTNQTFKLIGPIRERFINDKDFKANRENNEDFKNSINEIFEYPIHDENKSKRIANFLTGEDIFEKISFDEDTYITKLNDYSEKLDLYFSYWKKNHEKTMFSKFINEFNEILEANQKRGTDEEFYFKKYYNDTYTIFSPDSTLKFLDQINDLKVPDNILQEKYNDEQTIGEYISKKSKDFKILAELCTDPSRQSILSHAPKLTKQHSVFKDLLKEEKEKLKTKKNK